MKSIIKGLLLVAALALPLASFAVEGDSIITNVSDSVITTKVKAALAVDEQVGAEYIKVETNSDGMVVLSGAVDTKAKADKAMKITQSVEGVTGVKDNITILE